jgi:5'-nucleotidase
MIFMIFQDFGVEQCMKLNSKTNFPWLMSNLTKLDGSKLAATEEICVLEKDGKKYGFMGLVELGWISTLNCLDLDELIYEDYVLAANRLSLELRTVYKCDYIIALTHMRTYNDVRLAEESQDIDLILGGHDHVG